MTKISKPEASDEMLRYSGWYKLKKYTINESSDSKNLFH